MDRRERLVYLDGEMVPESGARVPLFDLGRLYGATFYESIRTFRHRWYRLEEHLARLAGSLRYAGIPIEPTMERAREALRRTLEANEGLTHPDDDLWACVEVTPGVGAGMPLAGGEAGRPLVLAWSAALPHAEYARCYREGKAAVTSLYRNVPPQCFDSRCKNRTRLPHYLSKRDARRVDPDAFALMLDLDGFLTEGTGANIFLARGGVLYTPTTRNILAGISRAVVMELAGKLGVRVVEADLTLHDAYNAEEAFWTTSSYCLLPICRFDGRAPAGPCPGPLAARLLEAWSAEAGVDIVAQSERFA